MNDPQRAFVFLSRDIQEILTDNEVDLVQQLNNNGLDVRGSRAFDPAQVGTSQAKSPELIILAAATGITIAAYGIARIIEVLARNKKVLVTQRRCVPVLDGTGTPMLTKAGQPILQWVDETQLLEATSSEPNQSTIKVGLGGDIGFSFELTTGSKE